jgi:hypothetical protein
MWKVRGQGCITIRGRFTVKKGEHNTYVSFRTPWDERGSRLSWKDGFNRHPSLAKVTPLCEKGFKVRVVTALETDTVVRGHALRDLIWPFVQSSNIFDIGDDLQFEGTQIQDNELILSADLSRATDVVGPGLALGFFEELHRKRGDVFDHKWLELAKDAFGPYDVRYKDGKRLVSSAGWLMGHPATWVVLCLVHYAIADIAGFDGRMRIRGDDLIAVGTQDNIDEYFALMERYFLINKKKSFVSAHGGVFAERTFVRRGNSICELYHAAPPRGWLYGELAATSNCYSQAEKLTKKFKKSYLSALFSSSSKLISALQRNRIPLFLPRCIGGVGLPKVTGVSGAVAGSVLVSKMVTGHGSVASAWTSRMGYRRRTGLLDESRSVTMFLHELGALSSCVPMTEEVLSHLSLVSDLMMGCTWEDGYDGPNGPERLLLDQLQPPSISSLGRDWGRFRQRMRGVKPPPHVVGAAWSEQRLSDSIIRQELLGVYWPYRPDPTLSIHP